MTNPTDIRKRIVFIVFTLGILAGLTAYLGYKAAISQNPALIAVVPALLLTSIPMVNALRRLLKDLRNPE